MDYRNLTETEISQLIENGCFADDWSKVKVNAGFDTKRLYKVHFEGDVKIGLLSGKVEVEKGIKKPSGISHSYIENCCIGENVYIANVSNLVRYNISDGVAIENVNTLAVIEENTFGNGVELEVLNEGGGRDLPIFDKMSSQIAYLMVNYRHDAVLTEKLGKIIGDYVETKKSDRGTIGTGAKIINTTAIRNVNIGGHTQISGAKLLENGTIGSCKEAPTTIGDAVIAKDFIVLSGSKIDSGALVDNTFVGQSVKMGKQYSAEGSAFFANCEGFHGEACSLFAGPYTVTHHKSSLLIAGQFSFYNAGSGTNQSNHMYKLGPLHQGTLERGSKTGSFSYLLWPCHVGPFSVVMGKHGANFDTSDFPFSYINVDGDKSVLTPAMNLFTVGTKRDSEKWPNRDKRKDPEKLDLIHFDLFSPFVVQKMVNGSNILKELNDNASKKQEYVSYKGAHILRLMLRTVRKYYEMGIKVYLGNELAKRIEKSKAGNFEALKNDLMPKDEHGKGKWVDILGMFAPQCAINHLCDNIKGGKIADVKQLQAALKDVFKDYDKTSWTWCADLISQRLDTEFKNITKEHVLSILKDWKTNIAKLNNMILKDAGKEFDPNSKIGFGIDGDNETRDKDFEAVRGSYEGNKFVKGLKAETEELTKKADDLLTKIEKL